MGTFLPIMSVKYNQVYNSKSKKPRKSHFKFQEIYWCLISIPLTISLVGENTITKGLEDTISGSVMTVPSDRKQDAENFTHIAFYRRNLLHNVFIVFFGKSKTVAFVAALKVKKYHTQSHYHVPFPFIS